MRYLRNGSSFQLPLLACFCATLWGSAFPCIKTAYQYFDAQNFELLIAWAGLRFFLAGGMILVFTTHLPWKQLSKTPFSLLIAVAFTQVVFQYGFFYSGIRNVSGILAAIIVASGSFWWVLLAPLFYYI